MATHLDPQGSAVNSTDSSTNTLVSKRAVRPTKHSLPTLCPSSQPNMADSRVFGIVAGTLHQPQVHYLRQTRPLEDDLLEQIQPLAPAEVFRLAAPCQETRCAHFDGQHCRLATRIVAQLPAASETLPACAIRSGCRWWQQEGKLACLRCEQILTAHYCPSDRDVQVATPHQF